MVLMQIALCNVLRLRASGKTPSPSSPCCVLFLAAAAGNAYLRSVSTKLHQFVPRPPYAHAHKRSSPYLPSNSPLFCPFFYLTVSIFHDFLLLVLLDMFYWKPTKSICSCYFSFIANVFSFFIKRTLWLQAFPCFCGLWRRKKTALWTMP